MTVVDKSLTPEDDNLTVGSVRPTCDFDTSPVTGTIQLGSLRFQVCARHIGSAKLQERLLSAPDAKDGHL